MSLSRLHKRDLYEKLRYISTRHHLEMRRRSMLGWPVLIGNMTSLSDEIELHMKVTRRRYVSRIKLKKEFKSFISGLQEITEGHEVCSIPLITDLILADFANGSSLAHILEEISKINEAELDRILLVDKRDLNHVVFSRSDAMSWYMKADFWMFYSYILTFVPLHVLVKYLFVAESVSRKGEVEMDLLKFVSGAKVLSNAPSEVPIEWILSVA